MPRGNKYHSALASSLAFSNSTEVVIESDHGTQIRLQEPKHPDDGHGYAGWRVSIERAQSVLPHDTQARTTFMFRVVRRITDIYRHRPNARQQYSVNFVVARMRRLLQSIDIMFEEDKDGDREWVAKIPHKGDIFAVAFVAKGFQLGKAIAVLFTAWGLDELARVPGTMPITPAIAHAGKRVAATGAPKNVASSSKVDVEVSQGENIDDAASDSDATGGHMSGTDDVREPDSKLIEMVLDLMADTVSDHGDSLETMAVRMCAYEDSSLHEQGRVARFEEELQAAQTRIAALKKEHGTLIDAYNHTVKLHDAARKEDRARLVKVAGVVAHLMNLVEASYDRMELESELQEKSTAVADILRGNFAEDRSQAYSQDLHAPTSQLTATVSPEVARYIKTTGKEGKR